MRSEYDLIAGRLVGFAVRAGIAALGVTIGLFFLFAPEQATQTFREVVQSAQALVQKDPPKKADEPKETQEARKSVPSPARIVRRASAAPPVLRDLTIKDSEPSPTPPHTSHERTFPSVDLQLGTERATLREMFGQPDLALYTQEREHVLEQFVYVNRVQNDATSVLLVDGRVASVSLDNPTVRTPTGSHFSLQNP